MRVKTERRSRAVQVLLLMSSVYVSGCEITVSSPNGNSSNTQVNSQNSTSPVADIVATPSPALPCRILRRDGNGQITVSSPCDGDTVEARMFAEGVVSDSNAEVWVIIHPLKSSDYWVQPRVSVREGGKWKVLCYLGQPGSVDSRKHFEIRAIANPKAHLRENQLLSGWPKAQSISRVIEVVRK